jgi:hypothetical protein
MQGRRVPDGTRPYELDAGEYTCSLTTNVAETETWLTWYVCAPDGAIFYLCNEHNPDRNGRVHQVEEHEDGSISVLPQPANSNSILSPSGWHGYIRHGVWEAC